MFHACDTLSLSVDEKPHTRTRTHTIPFFRFKLRWRLILRLWSHISLYPSFFLSKYGEHIYVVFFSWFFSFSFLLELDLLLFWIFFLEAQSTIPLGKHTQGQTKIGCNCFFLDDTWAFHSFFISVLFFLYFLAFRSGNIL
ncbi:hypothetical protein QBC44DRAFT_136172 [Cladorrhinum sp. PSN332]|nr:hypothetical protein QBC44DRAFT_136172 [Cladorrhinum sp. PSN332]